MTKDPTKDKMEHQTLNDYKLNTKIITEDWKLKRFVWQLQTMTQCKKKKKGIY